MNNSFFVSSYVLTCNYSNIFDMCPRHAEHEIGSQEGHRRLACPANHSLPIFDDGNMLRGALIPTRPHGTPPLSSLSTFAHRPAHIPAVQLLLRKEHHRVNRRTQDPVTAMDTETTTTTRPSQRANRSHSLLKKKESIVLHFPMIFEFFWSCVHCNKVAHTKVSGTRGSNRAIPVRECLLNDAKKQERLHTSNKGAIQAHYPVVNKPFGFDTIAVRRKALRGRATLRKDEKSDEAAVERTVGLPERNCSQWCPAQCHGPENHRPED